MMRSDLVARVSYAYNTVNKGLLRGMVQPFTDC